MTNPEVTDEAYFLLKVTDLLTIVNDLLGEWAGKVLLDLALMVEDSGITSKRVSSVNLAVSR